MAQRPLPHCCPPSPVTRGIALIAVLWIVAALAIAVTGITQSVRSEIRSVAALRDDVQAQALGEAAIALVLQQLIHSPKRLPYLYTSVSYQGQEIRVQAQAINGWIDLNKAEAPLLMAAFRIAGGLPEAQALTLAQAVVQWRNRRNSAGQLLDFEAVSDLLRLPGVDYDLYARLAPLLTTDARGSGRVNPQAAPLEVLTVLTQGHIAQAQALMQRRRHSDLPMDTTSFERGLTDPAQSARYRLQAELALPDGRTALVRRDVDLRPDAATGLLWRVFYAESGLAPTAALP